MQEEKFGTRNRSYSAWHRRLSVCRYVGIEKAQVLAMIDLDAALYVEYDDATKEPLAFIETAQDIGQMWKSATVTANLSKRTNPVIPAYCVLYMLSDYPNPADENWPDIKAFRVKRLWPKPEKEWQRYTPQEWAERLCELRKWSARRVDREILGLGEIA